MCQRETPRVLVVHVGINNLQLRYGTEYEIMEKFMVELSRLKLCIERLPKCINVALSSIIVNSNPVVNARVEWVNERLRVMCQQAGWFYMGHEDMRRRDLADGLHLNHNGEKKFLQALNDCLLAVVH